MAEDVSLEAFATAHPVNRRCWTCNVPERPEIDANKGKVPVPTMVAWLQSLGREATAAKLNFHFTARHHVL